MKTDTVKSFDPLDKVKRETNEEIDLLDTMLSSLVKLLEEKGIITQEEYEKRIKEKAKSNETKVTVLLYFVCRINQLVFLFQFTMYQVLKE